MAEVTTAPARHALCISVLASGLAVNAGLLIGGTIVYEHFTALREDMDVYDVNGDKVGKTNKMYQPTIVSSTPSTLAEPVGQPFVKIDTGFLGLGKHLYIPATAIADVSGDRVTLNVDKDRFDDMGWDEPPDFIDD